MMLLQTHTRGSPMDEDILLKTLHYMGITKDTYPVVAMLPLVQVAWADEHVQSGERDLILKVARNQFLLSDEALIILSNWLEFRPTDAYLQAGSEVLVALANRTSWTQISMNTINDVVGLCYDVAKVAGGLFGIGSIESREKSALTAIATALNLDHQQSIDHVFMAIAPDTCGEDPHSTEVIHIGDGSGVEPEDASHIRFHPGRVSVPSANACLRFENGKNLLVFPLHSNSLSIGRSRTNDIQLRNDPFVSKHHCRINLQNAQWTAEDLNSVNGVTINGQQIQRRILLGGERFRIGQTNFEFILNTPA
jgi:hypothetical protein